MGLPISQCIQSLVEGQNQDGGWGYTPGGCSWTEPTGFALLALNISRADLPHLAHAKALKWLQAQRREGGGWSPHREVREATWVTALTAFVLHRLKRLGQKEQAIRWLMEGAGQESTWANRARRFLLGADELDKHPGWPWFPGAASWIAPTSLTILALRALEPETPGMGILTRVEVGRGYLIGRRCADGGWNHGSSRALGYDGDSYPETTGMALLALAGTPKASLEVSVRRGLEHIKNVRGVAGWSWLQMGLRAHGMQPTTGPPPHRIHAHLDTSLYLLALATMAGRPVWPGAA